MITTDSFTPCCKSPNNEACISRWLFLCVTTLLALWLGLNSAPVQAQSYADVIEMRLERTEDGLYLNAALGLVLPDLAKDALYKGIPMFFVMESQVQRERWYWSDRTVAEAARYFRLSFQPLTRRWRLSTSPAPLSNTGLGVVLGQSFDDLEEALSAVQRISRWKIADAGVLETDSKYTLHFRFRLDLSQLPRPFQIGAVGRSDWSLLAERSQRFTGELTK